MRLLCASNFFFVFAVKVVFVAFWTWLGDIFLFLSGLQLLLLLLRLQDCLLLHVSCRFSKRAKVVVFSCLFSSVSDLLQNGLVALVVVRQSNINENSKLMTNVYFYMRIWSMSAWNHM